MKKTIVSLLSLVSLVVSLALQGCATTPVSTSAATPTPDSRIYDRSYLEKKSNTGEVVIKRDSGFAGSACYRKVFLDGSLVAELDIGEKITLHVPEGKHIISAQPNNPCAGALAEVEVVASPTKTTTFRMGSDGQGAVGIYPTAF